MSIIATATHSATVSVRGSSIVVALNEAAFTLGNSAGGAASTGSSHGLLLRTSPGRAALTQQPIRTDSTVEANQQIPTPSAFERLTLIWAGRNVSIQVGGSHIYVDGDSLCSFG